MKRHHPLQIIMYNRIGQTKKPWKVEKMRVHYYFGWFNDTIPTQLAKVLQDDLVSRKSLVMIGTHPSNYEDSTEMSDMVKDLWFGPLGLIFDEYHSIDYRTTKERAQELLRDASAIFLHGGNPGSQKAFLAEYELSAAIEASHATAILGASAGAMNMCAKFLSGEVDAQGKEIWEVLGGLDLDHFVIETHSTIHDIEALQKSNLVQNGLMSLSKDFDVYIACEESTIRIKDGKMDIMGDVYLISDMQIRKMPETFQGPQVP